MADPLKRLIQPKSIAVFGGTWAHSVIEQCQKMGFAGDIWPVHPSKKTVLGLPCFASIDALPAPPDASFIGVNRDATIDIVRQLSSIGAGGAVCFAAGFSEAAKEDSSAVERQQGLLQAAASMPILGPNCYGFINYLDGALLWPDQHGGQRVQSGVAILTQSSNIAINLTMQTRGLPIAYVLTAGNQAQVSLAQQAVAVLQDDRVTALGLHIEGFSDIREYEALAELAQALDKPIVAIKVGKTETARRALESHTSSMTGQDTAADEFLRRLGIGRVESLAVFLETLKVLHLRGTSMGSRLLSMSCSGGEACLMADAVLNTGLNYPELTATQTTQLRQALGPRVALANPLDYHTYIWNDQDAMRAMMSAMLAVEADLAILVLDFPRVDRCSFDSWDVAIDAYLEAGKHWQGTLAVLASMPENMPEFIADKLMAEGVLVMCGLHDAMQAVDCAQTIRQYKQQRQTAPPEPVWLSSANSTMEKAIDSIELIDEAKAKQLLAQHKIAVPFGISLTGEQCATADTVSAALSQVELSAPPYVVKRLGLAHKSEHDGLVLGVDSQAALIEQVIRLGAAQGCLVEQHIQQIVHELLVSVVSDPVHGLLLSVGAGGVTTNLQQDIVQALLPVRKDCLQPLLSKLRCYPILEGYRGQAGIDMQHLFDLIMQIQTLALALGDKLVELELNPVLCTTQSNIVADALLKVHQHD